jgi:predicted methyltransferase
MIFNEERKLIEVRRKKKETVQINYRGDNDIFGTNKDKKIFPKREYAKISRDTSENRLTDKIRVYCINTECFTIS